MILALLLAAAAAAPPPGEIAFVASAAALPPRVQVVTLDSRALRPIGPEHATGRPAWSPIGAQIAFAVEVDGSSRIFVSDAEGAEGRFVQHGQAINRGPVWAADGGRLAYTSGTGLDSQLLVAAWPEGTERVWGGGRTSLGSPAWISQALVDLLFERLEPDSRGSLLRSLLPSPSSPGVLIAVGLAGPPGALSTDLYLVSETEAVPLPAALLPSIGAYEEFAPAASRDMLAFESNDGGDREIFLMNRRGAWDLSNHPAADWAPVWSPDGRWLAFESFRGGTRGVYRCHKQTTRVLAVAAGSEGDAWDAAWSPDSRWIAYTTDRDGAPAVWARRTGGDERVRVSPANLRAVSPAWRPSR